MPRRRRQRERQTNNGLNKQNKNSARASRFFCTFLCRHGTTTTGKCLISVLRSSNTGNIFAQLVAQHCCVASWKGLLPVLPSSLSTCHTTNFDGGRKQTTAKFSFSSWTWIWFIGNRLEKNSHAFDKVNHEFEKSRRYWKNEKITFFDVVVTVAVVVS